MEPNVVIRVRQIDQALVESIFDSVQDTYKNVCKKETVLKIDSDNFLAAESCGGVELISHRGNPFQPFFYFKSLCSNLHDK